MRSFMFYWTLCVLTAFSPAYVWLAVLSAKVRRM